MLVETVDKCLSVVISFPEMQAYQTITWYKIHLNITKRLIVPAIPDIKFIKQQNETKIKLIQICPIITNWLRSDPFVADVY